MTKLIMHQRPLRSKVARNTRLIILTLIITLSFLTLLPLKERTSSAESLSGWLPGTSYPTNIFDESCVVNSGYIYCVGGSAGSGSPYSSAVYYAPMSPSGIGTWASTTSYPIGIISESCATYASFIYCVGGETTGNVVTTEAYFASISSSGVGAWSSTTSYPFQITAQSCAAYTDYIYCVGGLTNGGIDVDSVYYAAISSSGVGTWLSTTTYPMDVDSQYCTTYSGYMYCVGGENSSGIDIDNVNYAPISSSGVGAWSSTTSYPADVEYHSCVAFSDYIYCVGGATNSAILSAVSYAPISSAGVGTWSSTAGYPASIYDESCVPYAGYIYCVGGFFTSAVYYTEIFLSGSMSPWSSTTSYPFSLDLQSCVTYSGYIYCVGGYNGSPYTSDIYYAPVSTSGVYSWSSTTSYPTDIAYQSCAAYSGYIYCVGGRTNSAATDAVYYAPISSSGVGTWSSTTNYPSAIYSNSCSAYSGYIYCVGGTLSSGDVTYAVAYASISSSGVGTWSFSSNYPKDITSESCITSSGYIYCIAGEGDSEVLVNVNYYAPISSSGVGSWSSATSYPMDVNFHSCVAYSGYIYCTGGNTGSGGTNAAYFAPISASGIGTWSFTTSYPSDIYAQSCAAYNDYIYCVGGGPVLTDDVYYAQISSPTVTTSTTLTSTLTTTFSTTVTSTLTGTITSTSTQTSTTTVTSPTTTTATTTIFSGTTTQLVPTATTLKCSPKSVALGSSTICTATVTSADGSKLPGTVTFSSSVAGTFGTVSCVESGTGTKCTVTYISSTSGTQTLTGTYPGDVYHSSSFGTFSLKVTV